MSHTNKISKKTPVFVSLIVIFSLVAAYIIFQKQFTSIIQNSKTYLATALNSPNQDNNIDNNLQKFIMTNCAADNSVITTISPIIKNFECQEYSYLLDKKSAISYTFILNDDQSQTTKYTQSDYYWRKYKIVLYENKDENISIILSKNRLEQDSNEELIGMLNPKIRYAKNTKNYQITIDYDGSDIENEINRIIREKGFHYSKAERENQYGTGIAGDYYGEADDYLYAFNPQYIDQLKATLKNDPKFDNVIKEHLRKFQDYASSIVIENK